MRRRSWWWLVWALVSGRRVAREAAELVKAESRRLPGDLDSEEFVRVREGAVRL